MMKTVVVLGSTGSIGASALDIVRRNRATFRVRGLSARGSVAKVAEQVREFAPEFVAMADRDAAATLRGMFPSLTVLDGDEGVTELASMPCDVVVVGIIGMAALKPVMACIGKAKRMVLANKEAVLSAGDLLMSRIHASDTELVPVDSEAWGVYRLMRLADGHEVKSVYITASGGPFFFKDASLMQTAQIKDVLAHPVWDMGARITVDSASFMNKGFEVIETHRIFGVPLEKIKVLVHPQSSVHALLETADGAVFSSMFSADMRIPIGYGICHPQDSGFSKPLDLAATRSLEFFEPDNAKFPFLPLAYDVAGKGGNLPAVLSAADEIAVHAFLGGTIAFKDLYPLVERCVRSAPFTELARIEDVFYWDEWTKTAMSELVRANA